jgi:hypothetical protein
MAILAALFAFGSRFVGKILTTAMGWATTLLFGRVPASRQYLLLGIAFGSVIWMVLLAGILVPDVATFLLVLVPGQGIVPESIIRLLMLIGALIAPAIIGGLTLALDASAARTPGRIARAVARGYPLTVLLAVLLVFLAGLAIVRKGRSLARGWTDAHVALVVKPGAYDDVAADLDAAVSAAGLDVEPRAAPATMSTPARWLAAVAGSDGAALVPDRMIQLHGPELDILIYPMDLLISGKPGAVARARAAMASRLTTSAAHLTVSAEGQAIEDRLTLLATRPDADGQDRPPRFDDHARDELADIDETLARIEIPYEEWEVLYRQRLQVERDLRAGSMAGDAVLGAPAPEEPGGVRGVAVAALTKVGQIVRSGATAVVEATADPDTVAAVEKWAGPEWKVAVRAASVGASAVQAALEGAAEATEEAPKGSDGDADSDREKDPHDGADLDADDRPDADAVATTAATGPAST